MSFTKLKDLFATQPFSTSRNILLISSSQGTQNALRVLAISERWRLLFAAKLETATFILRSDSPGVVLLDGETVEDWGAAVLRLNVAPACPCIIVLAPAVHEMLRRRVFDLGGFEVLPKPLNRERVKAVVNGAIRLLDDVDGTAPRR